MNLSFYPKSEPTIWTKWLRVCALCNGHWLANETLCQKCMEALFAKASKFAAGPHGGKPPGYNFPVFSFLDLEANGLASLLIYSLKKSTQKSVFSPLARLFLQIHGGNLRHLSPFDRLVLVSAPKSTLRRIPDHAESWCLALADCLFPDLLLKSGVYLGTVGGSKSSQKQLSRRQRLQRQVEFSSEERELAYSMASKALFVYCDDLITTGSTASATHRALGSPKNFVVCTIAVSLSQCYNASQ